MIRSEDIDSGDEFEESPPRISIKPTPDRNDHQNSTLTHNSGKHLAGNFSGHGLTLGNSQQCSAVPSGKSPMAKHIGTAQKPGVSRLGLVIAGRTPNSDGTAQGTDMNGALDFNTPTTSKALLCSHCNNYFIDEIVLKKHLYKVIEQIRFDDINTDDTETDTTKDANSKAGFECSICKLNFATKSAVLAHKKEKHTELRTKINKERETADIPAEESLDDEQSETCEEMEVDEENDELEELPAIPLTPISNGSNLEKKFLCTLCNTVFPSYYATTKHRDEVHPSSYNNRIFRKIFVPRHNRPKSDVPVVQIDGLNKVIIPSSLSRNITINTTKISQKYRCSKCKQTFANKNKANAHLKTCGKTAPPKDINKPEEKIKYFCRECHKIFPTIHSTRLHRREEHPNAAKKKLFHVIGNYGQNPQKTKTSATTTQVDKEASRKRKSDQVNDQATSKKRALNTAVTDLVENVDSPTIYRCSRCDIHFTTTKVISDHFKTLCSKENSGAVHCKKCGLPFTCNELMNHSLRDHRKDGHSNFTVVQLQPKAPVATEETPTKESKKAKLYKCVQCNAHFGKASSLRSHLWHKLHNQTQTSCPICHYTFLESSFNRHVSLHHDRMRLHREDFEVSTDHRDTPDDSSDESSSSEESDPSEDENNTPEWTPKRKAEELPPAMKTSERKKERVVRKCTVCSKRVLVNSSKTHSRGTICTRCTYRSRQPINASMATPKQTSKKDVYKCNVCSLHFVAKGPLRTHVNAELHQSEFRVGCPECGLMFSDASITRHIKMHHRELLLTVDDYNIITNFDLDRAQYEITNTPSSDNNKDSEEKTKTNKTPKTQKQAETQKDAARKEPEHQIRNEIPLTVNPEQTEMQRLEQFEAEIDARLQKEFDTQTTVNQGQTDIQTTENLNQTEMKRQTDKEMTQTLLQKPSDAQTKNVSQESITEQNTDDNTERAAENAPQQTSEQNSDLRATIELFRCGDCDVYFLNDLECFRHACDHTPLHRFDYLKCPECGLHFIESSITAHRKTHHIREFTLEEVSIKEYRPYKRIKAAPKVIMHCHIQRAHVPAEISEKEIIDEMDSDTVERDSSTNKETNPNTQDVSNLTFKERFLNGYPQYMKKKKKSSLNNNNIMLKRSVDLNSKTFNKAMASNNKSHSSEGASANKGIDKACSVLERQEPQENVIVNNSITQSIETVSETLINPNIVERTQIETNETSEISETSKEATAANPNAVQAETINKTFPQSEELQDTTNNDWGVNVQIVDEKTEEITDFTSQNKIVILNGNSNDQRRDIYQETRRQSVENDIDSHRYDGDMINNDSETDNDTLQMSGDLTENNAGQDWMVKIPVTEREILKLEDEDTLCWSWDELEEITDDSTIKSSKDSEVEIKFELMEFDEYDAQEHDNDNPETNGAEMDVLNIRKDMDNDENIPHSNIEQFCDSTVQSSVVANNSNDEVRVSDTTETDVTVPENFLENGTGEGSRSSEIRNVCLNTEINIAQDENDETVSQVKVKVFVKNQSVATSDDHFGAAELIKDTLTPISGNVEPATNQERSEIGDERSGHNNGLVRASTNNIDDENNMALKRMENEQPSTRGVKNQSVIRHTSVTDVHLIFGPDYGHKASVTDVSDTTRNTESETDKEDQSSSSASLDIDHEAVIAVAEIHSAQTANSDDCIPKENVKENSKEITESSEATVERTETVNYYVDTDKIVEQLGKATDQKTSIRNQRKSIAEIPKVLTIRNLNHDISDITDTGIVNETLLNNVSSEKDKENISYSNHPEQGTQINDNNLIINNTAEEIFYKPMKDLITFEQDSCNDTVEPAVNVVFDVTAVSNNANNGNNEIGDREELPVNEQIQNPQDMVGKENITSDGQEHTSRTREDTEDSSNNILGQKEECETDRCQHNEIGNQKENPNITSDQDLTNNNEPGTKNIENEPKRDKTDFIHRNDDTTTDSMINIGQSTYLIEDESDSESDVICTGFKPNDQIDTITLSDTEDLIDDNRLEAQNRSSKLLNNDETINEIKIEKSGQPDIRKYLKGLNKSGKNQDFAEGSSKDLININLPTKTEGARNGDIDRSLGGCEAGDQNKRKDCPKYPIAFVSLLSDDED